jgi:hypothetical protein
MGVTFLAKYPGNMVVEHHAGADGRVHRDLPDCLRTGFANPWMGLASKGAVVQGLQVLRRPPMALKGSYAIAEIADAIAAN